MPRPSRKSPAPQRPGRGSEPGGAWLRDLAALGGDPERRDSLSADDLLMIAFQQCLYFAHTQDPGANAALAGLFPRLAERVPEDDRVELLERVTEAVESGGSSVVALLPFLQHEPSPGVVGLAALSFASLMPVVNGDEMTGPRTLVRVAEHAEDEGTRVGIAAGLLQLGDARVAPLLAELWRTLTPAGRVRFAGLRAPSPLVFAAAVEFWIGCLEDVDDRTFAAVAAALERLAAGAEPRRVLEVRRKFPANAPDERAEIAIEGDWPLAEYGARIAPRLRDLARRENEPLRLPAVLAAWGIDAAS